MGTIVDPVTAARQDQIAATAKMSVAVRKLQERAEKAERELATELLANAGLLHQLAEAEGECNGLLARIHRDGGHHTTEVGSTQSIADAHEVWAGLVRERDEYKSALEIAKNLIDITERERDEARARYSASHLARATATIARIKALPSTAGYVSALELEAALAPVHEEA